MTSRLLQKLCRNASCNLTVEVGESSRLQGILAYHLKDGLLRLLLRKPLG